MSEEAGKLVRKDDGQEVEIGTIVIANDGVTFTLMGWRRPHKISSSGRVFVMKPGDKFERAYFPHVFGLEIIDHGFSSAPEPTVVEDEQGNIVGESFEPTVD